MSIKKETLTVVVLFRRNYFDFVIQYAYLKEMKVDNTEIHLMLMVIADNAGIELWDTNTMTSMQIYRDGRDWKVELLMKTFAA